MEKSLMGWMMVGSLVGTVASAGQRTGWEVGVDTTNRNAYGTMGTVRNSLDAVQYIYCSVRTFNTGPTSYVYCAARNAAGTVGSCSNSSENFAALARSVTGDSYIYFNWDVDGNCTYLYVANNSAYEPKNP